MPDPKIIQFPLGLTENLQFHYTGKINVSSAEILQLNSVPKELVVAPGAGYILMPIHAIVKYHFGTISYATNLNVILGLDTGALILTFSNLINQVVDAVRFSNAGILGNNQPENEGIELSVQIGDPTAGDGNLDVYLWYIKHEL